MIRYVKINFALVKYDQTTYDMMRNVKINNDMISACYDSSTE